MTANVYTLTLDDSEAITLHVALSILTNTNKRNAARARQLIERINGEVTQTSGINFELLPTEEQPIVHCKTDFIDDK